ncbi:MAG TPA: hypothetical protein VFO31_13945 [Vicinamibacterales bacterium]|nr:hypothetical protein [Vicinamibacterales bacterium]
MINKTLAVLLLSAATAAAQVPAAGQQPAVPGQVPGAPGQQVPGQPLPGAKPPAGPPPSSATAARTFTAPVGLLFNTVRPDKTADFEKLVAAVRQTLESSSDPKLQAMAKGWHFYKAAEAGPGNAVVYVFVIDPVVPGEDYGLGRVLTSGSTDTAALLEIWKLYTGSVTSGGTLMNLSPIPEPPAEPAAGEKPAATQK